MRNPLLDILLDPISRTRLDLEVDAYGDGGTVLEGRLVGAGGRTYPVTRGIPRFTLSEDAGQQQTGKSFGFKWGQRHTYDSAGMRTAVLPWLLERYGFDNVEALRAFFANRRRILDVGCGSGFTSSLWLNGEWRGAGAADWVGAELSSAIDVARDRLRDIPGTEFVQADIMQLPFRDEAFDTIYAEGVLHHTPSTEKALQSLVPLLMPGGEMLFYVYRRKGAIREFADDYVRGVVSPLAPAEAWELLRPLTRLGQALASLHAEVEVPEDVPYLGIKAGRYDVQRLIYWHFAKMYWNDRLSEEENVHVNFDWYHPAYAHRHTEEEIRRWCADNGLSITHLDVQESGYTVRAVKE
jgi:arsenite methyltransferase